MVLEVDFRLQGEDYLKMKAEKYLLAVDEWNKTDKSKRHRTSIQSFVVGYLTQTAPLTEKKVIED